MSVARMAYERGLYAAAIRNYNNALAIGEQLKLSLQDLAQNTLGRAICHYRLGNFVEAEQLYKDVLEMDKRLFGSEDLKDLEDLSSLYRKTGKLPESEKLLQTALKIAQVSPCNPGDLASILKDLAQTYCEQGKLAEADACVRRACAIYESTTSRKTKLYAEILMTIASLSVRQSRCAEAAQFVREATQIMELITGGEHPDLAELLESASNIMREAGFAEEANSLSERTMAIRRHLKALDR